jgi:hypothetical protein
MATDDLRKDLRAAAAARQELGPEYEEAIIDSFLEKLDAREAQRHGREAELRREDQVLEAMGLKRREGADPGGLALAIISVIAAIPLTAIAAEQMGRDGVLMAWIGLVAINFARTLGNRRNTR